MDLDDPDVDSDYQAANTCSLEDLITACNEAGITIEKIKNDSSHLSRQQNQGSQSCDVQCSSLENVKVSSPDAAGSPESPGDLNCGRKRKKKADKSLWKREREKVKRERGESYMGSETIIMDKNTGKRKRKYYSRGVQEKRMGAACFSNKCLKSNKRHCDQFSQIDREKIFNNFWKKSKWTERKGQVMSLVDVSKPKQRRGKNVIPRSETFLYHLKKDGIRLQVCRDMFLKTLAIGEKQVRGWLTSRKTPSETKCKEKRPASAKTNFASNYLLMLPKLPSHYCRQSSSKLYLEPFFQSKRKVFSCYKEYCIEKGAKHVSWGTFYQLFEKMNLGLYQPKKDWCDTCASHKAGNVGDEEWAHHVILKDAARAEKSNDKKSAFDGDCHVVCVDLQAVQLCPFLNASSLYYKTKLLVHNYTVYDLKTRDVKCFLFDETQAELSASVFATCLVSFLERYSDGKPIIIYSDGCTNQNRNVMLSNALLDLAIKKKVVITQKFLEKGHTQMEVDSVHSAIERNMKNKSIFVPTDYEDICRGARDVPTKYEVEYLDFGFFRNYAVPKLQWYTSIRPGTKAGDKCVTHLRQIKYDPSGLIYYKLDFSGQWMSLPRLPAKLTSPQYPALYKNRLPISKRKFKDLQDLLHVLPLSTHSYYENLTVV